MYNEKYLEYPVLTPNSMILARYIDLPDDSSEEETFVITGRSDRDMYIVQESSLEKMGF